MDDLVQLVFFGLLILFGLMSSKKKKKQPPAPARRRVREQPPVQQVRRPPAAARVPDRRPVQSAAAPAKPAQPPRPRDLAEELMQLLQGRVPETKPSERALPPPEQLPEPDEARSLETLEEAGTASHKRFHEQYMEPAPAMEKIKRDRFTRARLELRGRDLREAFVLKEVLGPPKGME